MGQSDKEASLVKFDCKDSNCTEKLVYKRKIVFGVLGGAQAPRGGKVVYLTCSTGHTYPYTLPEG